MTTPIPCVQVAVPLPLTKALTYALPEALAGRLRPGCRVEVPVGSRTVLGVVLDCCEEAPSSALRPVLSCVETEASIPDTLLALLRWVSDYYMAPIGEVLRLALPPGMLAPDRVMIRLAPAGRALLAGLPAPALPTQSPAARRALLAALARLPLTGHVSRTAVLSRAGRMPPERLDDWETWGLIERTTAGDPRGRTRRVAVVEAAASREQGLALLERAPRQAELFVRLLAEGPLDRTDCAGDGAGARALSELIRRGLVAVRHRRVFRSPLTRHLLPGEGREAPSALWPDQEAALRVFRAEAQTESPRPVLLLGEPGSGKTEVYLRLAEEALAKGRSVLILVPEISLTPLLASRFVSRFGEGVAILHSALSPGERLDEWQRIRQGEARLVVGARSAVFAPLVNPGLIVVDEEQDGSFKSDDRVYYQARDVAVLRAQLEKALVCLGSATPSVESMHNVWKRRYALATLARPDLRQPPPVTLVDMGAIRTSARSLLSAELVLALHDRLERGEQSILLLNRRGWAPTLVCTSCKTPVRCEHCAVTLTYHRTTGELICHACGAGRPYPAFCPSCRREDLELVGVGTQRVEDELELTFPKARIGRLDRDAISRKGAMTDMLAAFAAGSLDILVGTQLVAKGHDFRNVTLVGVLNADVSLNLPDFRAGERTFQLLTQAAGRAGRGERPGEVIIQTRQPGHFVLACVRRHEVEAFYRQEIESRRGLYPPGLRLALLRLEGGDADRLHQEARRLAEGLHALRRLPAHKGLVLLGPAPAPLSRLRERWRLHLLVKSPNSARLHGFLSEAERGGLFDLPRDLRLVVDIDPGNMM